jgi:hypothetical protein
VHEEIRILDEALKKFLSCGGPEVQRYAKLIGVQVQKRSALFWMWEITRIWTAPSSGITSRLLNLNDFSAQIGHEFSGVWRADHAAAFDDTKAL